MLALGAVVLFASPAPKGATAYKVVSEQLVVQLSSREEAHPASVLEDLPGGTPQLLPGHRWSMDLPAEEAAAVEAQLSAERGVNYVSPVQAVHAALVPNNPCYDSTCGPTSPVIVENPSAGPGATIVHPNGQTDLWNINAPEAWSITTGSPNVLVAVLDSGVDAAHPQLVGKVVIGPDVCRADDPLCASPNDNYHHGTAVAGIIAAATNDGIGMAGLGWDTKVLSIKVLDDEGDGNTMDVATGIYDAVNAGARVINMSFSNEPCSTSPSDCGPDVDEQRAVEYALSRGVVVVAAAGNYGSSEPVYPASYPGVLSVAASTDQGSVDPANGGPYLDFSEYGNAANIAAPGVNILSTWYDGNYAVESGTSFAAPHVAAAAALVIAADPAISGPQVATLLQVSASPLALGSSPINGGFLNVGAAVEAAAAHRVPEALDGYLMASANGDVYSTGPASAQGPMGSRRAHQPVVAAAEAPSGLGYWLATSGGDVFAFGKAPFLGPTATGRPREPVVAMAPAPSGRGYWLATRDGAIFAFGDARSYGSLTRARAARPIVGMAATPDGKGYWLVASDGGVFAFGDARYYGSAAKLVLHRPIVGMAATPDGKGYWLVASDGGVFAFGDATFYGSMGYEKLKYPVVGMAPSPNGLGYWLATSSGQVFAFGAAPDEATVTPVPPSARIVAIAS
ncbi:MAG: S8 family serine peptidase [Acidimicrobiales bacterium]